MKKILLLLFLALTANAIQAQNTYYVKHDATGVADGSSWTNAFTSIQDYLDNATTQDGDSIFVAAGTYIVDATMTPVGQGIKFYGGFAGTETSLSERDATLMHTTNETILSGDINEDDIAGDFFNNKTDNLSRFFMFNNANNFITIDGFTFKGAYGAQNPIIERNSNTTNFTNLHFNNNIVEENTATSVLIRWDFVAATINFNNNSIRNNKISNANAGLLLFGTTGSTGNVTVNFVNTLVADNEYGSDWGGIWLRGAQNFNYLLDVNIINSAFINNNNTQSYAHLINVSGQNSNDLSVSVNFYNSIEYNTTISSSTTPSQKTFHNSKPSEGAEVEVFANNSMFNHTTSNISNVTIASSTTDGQDPGLDANYMPTASSVNVLDQGDDTLYNTAAYSSVDLAGNPRFSSTIDIGPYEFDAGCPIVNIPDPTFKNILLSGTFGIDTNGDGEICVDEAAAYTGSISVGNNPNITDITGIEAFVNITVLNAFSCNITGTVDLTNNTALQTVNLMLNDITSIDVTGLTNLKVLVLRNNSNLSGLDITTNTALEALNVDNISLSGLDVTNNVNLSELFARNCGLTSIDLSANTNLEYIFLYDNAISTLDLSANTALVDINIGNNGMTNLTLPVTNTLTGLNSFDNPLVSSLDLSPYTNLEFLTYADAGINTIDLSMNTELKGINLSNNNLSTIDLTNQPLLFNYLNLAENSLTTIDLSVNTALQTLLLDDNLLTTISLVNNTALNTIYLSENLFTAIDLSANTNLTTIYCSDNPNLSALNVATGYNNTMSLVEAINNPNLSCVQIDAGFTPPTNQVGLYWAIDSTAQYSDNCAALSSEAFENEVFGMYPNPASTQFTVAGTLAIEKIEVYSLQGQLVQSTNQTTVDIAALPTGVYLVTIVAEGTSYTQKLAKQ